MDRPDFFSRIRLKNAVTRAQLSPEAHAAALLVREFQTLSSWPAT